MHHAAGGGKRRPHRKPQLQRDHETINLVEAQNRKAGRFKNTLVIQMCLFVECAGCFLLKHLNLINVIDCWTLYRSVVCCFSVFALVCVSSGPRCQSAHQSAGLLLHRSAAQWHYTWAGPRCGSTEVTHTCIISRTRCVAMATSRLQSCYWLLGV